MSDTSQLDSHLAQIDFDLARFAIPIYGMRGKRAPTLLGTGFLLEIVGRHFVVTAAHVLANERECEIAVPGTQGLFLLPPMFRTLHAGSDHDFDIAFDELPSRLSAALRRYRAVPISWASANHVPDERYVYTMVGFPTSRNKPGIKDNMLRAIAHRFHGETLAYEEYEREGLDVALHLALRLQSLNIKTAEEVFENRPAHAELADVACGASVHQIRLQPGRKRSRLSGSAFNIARSRIMSKRPESHYYSRFSEIYIRTCPRTFRVVNTSK